MPFRLPRLLQSRRRVPSRIYERVPTGPPKWFEVLREGSIAPRYEDPPPPSVPQEALRTLLGDPRRAVPPESPLEVLDRHLRSSVYEDPTSLPLPEPLPEPDPRQLPLVELPGTTQPLMVETAGARTLHEPPLIPMLPLMIRDEEIRRALSHPVQEIPSLDPAATDALLQNPEPSQLFMPSPKPGLPLMLEPPPSGPAGQLRFLARPGTMETPEGEIRPTDQPELYVPPLFSGPEPEIPPQPPLNRGWDEDTVGALPGKLPKELIGKLKEQIPPETEPQMAGLWNFTQAQGEPERGRQTTDALIAQDLTRALKRLEFTPWQAPITAEQGAQITADLAAKAPRTFPVPLPRHTRQRRLKAGGVEDLRDPALAPPSVSVDQATGERQLSKNTLQQALEKVRLGRTDLTREEQYHLDVWQRTFGPEPGGSVGVERLIDLPPDLARKRRVSLGAEAEGVDLERIVANMEAAGKSPGQIAEAVADRWTADYNEQTMPVFDRIVNRLIRSAIPGRVQDLLDEYRQIAALYSRPVEREGLARDIVEAIRNHGADPTRDPRGQALAQQLRDMMQSFRSLLAPAQSFADTAIVNKVGVVDELGGLAPRTLNALDKAGLSGVDPDKVSTDAWQGIQEPGDALTASPYRVTLDQQRRRQNPQTGEWYDAPMGVSPYENVDEWPSMPRVVTGTPGPPPVGIPGDMVRLKEAVGDVPAGTVGRLVSVTGAPDVEQGARLRFEEGGLGPSLEQQADRGPNAAINFAYRQPLPVDEGDVSGTPPSELVPIARIELEDGRQIQVPHTQVENTFAPRRSDQPPIAATPRRGGTAAEWRQKRDERRLTAETQLTATALQKAGDPDRYMQMAPSIELFKRLLSAVERRKNLKAGRDPLGRRPRPEPTVTEVTPEPKALPEPAPKKKKPTQGMLPLAGLVGAAGASLLAGVAGQPKKEDQGMWGQQLPELEGVEPTEAGLGGGFSRMLAKMMQRGAQALDSSVLEEIRQEQMAPVVRKSTQQMPTRLKDRFVGEHEYLEDTGRSIEKNLRKAGKYVSQAVLDMLPHRQIPVNVRGGMGEAHQSAARIGQTLTSMSTQTLDKTRAYLNTLGYEREWDLVERKIADADAQYAALMAKGDAKGAQTVLKAAADLRRAVEDRTVVPKGLTKAQVLTERQRLLRGMTPQERTQVTNATWTIFKEIQDGVDALFTEGGIDPAVYQEWKKRGPEYFPLHRLLTVYDPKNRERLKPLFLGAPEGTRAARVRLGVAHSSLLDPEMRGSKLVNVDPLEGTAHILEGLHNDVRRLRVAKNVLRSLDATQQFASPDLQLFVRRSYEDEPVPEGYGKVAWLDNNIPQYYLVNKDLERGFAALDAGDIVDAVEIAATTRRLYHSMAATANLRFMVKQMVIDPVVMSFLPHYGKYSGRNWMPAIETAWPTYVRGWMAMYPGKLLERMGSPFQLGRQRYLNEVRKSGFYESGAAAQPLGVRGSLYRDMVGPWESEFRKSSHKGTRAWRYGLEAIQEIGLEPNELAVKYAGYKTLRKEGYGPMEAAAETRAYVGSPDFNKWGWMTRKYGKNAFMFIGPTISGMHRIARRIHETPDKMAEFVLGAMLVELAADQWNDQFKDANGVSPTAYADRRTRAQNVMIVDPEKKPQQLSNGDLRWPMIKIPKPPEMVALQAPVMAIKFAMEDQDYTALQGFAHIIEQWIPGGGSLEGKDVGSLGYSVVGRGLSGLNPLYRVLPEQLVGEGGWNFTLGAPIVGTRTQGKIPELQFTPYTDPTIKALSRGISDVTKQRAPEMLRSPDRLQHLVNTFLPGLGEIALGMGRPFFPTPQTLRGVESESERTVHRPIIGPITRTFYDPGTQNQQRADDLKKLFSKADETGTAQETINRLITTGNVEEFQRVPPELFQRATENQGIAALQRELSQINTLRETVLVNPDYTPEQRRQALADLWALERDLLHRLSIWTPQ